MRKKGEKLNNGSNSILSLIDTPKELRMLSEDDLKRLCDELREFLLNSVKVSGGHLSSGLGSVELAVAMHYVYDTPFDNLIWDTGHQSYPHKILTGRKRTFKSIRKRYGLHPFPCREESEYDVLSVGHSSTSISAGLGMSVSSEYEKKGRKTICIIGDGAITSGIAFEAINHAGYLKKDILIVLNDNRMSISENVGALNNYFRNIERSYKNKNKFLKFLNFFDIYKKKKCKTIFEYLGFKQFGPIDGNDIFTLLRHLKNIKESYGPKFLHVITKKGKGYKPAEKDPIKWHSISNLNKINHIIDKKKLTFSEVFGEWICKEASCDSKLIAITPAMTEGSGMKKFSKLYPNQYFDVAISEQHAVTFAAGLAIKGYNPIVSIYSTFLQRAYDQIIHDVALQKLPILFAVDRAGIVGEDGKTHQGAFDLSFLRCLPNMIIMSPSDEDECFQMLHTGYHIKDGPTVVRYPKGKSCGAKLNSLKRIFIGKGVIKRTGKKIAILNFGTLLHEAMKAATILDSTVIDMRFVKPLDKNLILYAAKTHKLIVTIEENVIYGGAGSGVNEFILKSKLIVNVLNLGLPDVYIPHGKREEIQESLGLSSKGIEESIKKFLKKI
ncbi:1-deoxy-D-xylulose-5-phosphate synthase [Candidatus Riesia sp. GBBU]|nr:1-deoxy-D-xylulose-5-phosphate synthase [Candidatus Riesia sp. GBBU]